MAAPKAILFDWDNTLVDTWPVIHEALHNTFTAMGLEPWSLETVKKRVAKSMRDSFPEVFGANWEEAAKIYQKAYQAIQLEKIKPLPGAEDTLALLRSMNMNVAVVSNKRGVNLRKEVTHLGWDKYFYTLVGSDDSAKDKPHPEPVIHALKPVGLSPSADCWFVGDSVIDLECAQNTGCKAIFYGNAHKVEGAPGNYSCEGFNVWQKCANHIELQKFLS